MPAFNHQRRTAVGSAVLALCAALAGGGAGAAIVTSGQVTPSPLPAGPISGALNVGNGGTGTLTVNGGSTLSAERLTAGNQVGDAGTITVTGAGSQISTNFNVVGNFRNTNIGSQGTGRLEVLDGATFLNGTNDAACIVNCRLMMSNGAGSTGSLLVSGAGSTLNAFGMVRMGHVSVFTQALDGFQYGTPGGASSGRMDITLGGVVNSNSGQLGNIDPASRLTGSETSTGAVVIDGPGSRWNLVRDAAQGNSTSLLLMGHQPNGNGTVEIRNGGVLHLDSSATPTRQSGITLGTNSTAAQTNTAASLVVSGAGSQVLYTGGDSGFLNLGFGNGNVSSVSVLAGGQIKGASDNGDLVFLNVGRGNGGTGTLTIDGNGSLVRLAGNTLASGGVSASNAGAFMHVGRTVTTAGQGTLNITGGGRLEIAGGASTGNPDALAGFMVGRGAGAVGTMNISGAGSVAAVSSGTVVTPYVAIGRDGGTASLNISAGGQLLLTSQHLSAPSNTNLYAPGEGLFLEIGRRFEGGNGVATTGTLRIDGAGSAVVMSGTADRLINLGRAADDPVANPGTAHGTLEITNGGRLETTALFGGTRVGGSASITMDGGHMLLTGSRLGGPTPPAPAAIGLGRYGGSATMTMRNGSTLLIESTTDAPQMALGGTASNPGGTATVVVQSGSMITVNGPEASIFVGRIGSATSTGVGTMVIEGNGSAVSVNGTNGRFVIAREANTVGNVVVGAGSTLSATNFIGVGHASGASTGGNATLVVNGTATTNQLVIGSGGYLGGAGVINANVTNFGTINAGNSPGRLTINGDFDSSQGEIVLEVQDLGNGQWAYDEIVLGNPAALNVGNARIRFEFLGVSDPTAFENAGLFELDTFFKELDASGNVVDLDPDRGVLFDAAQWTASAAQYVISNFVFNPVRGASFTAVPVPAPASLALALLALAMLGLTRPRSR